MNKILITGGAGNVGSALAHKLVLNEDNFIVIVDSLVTGSKDKLPSNEYNNWRFIKADVNNFEEISTIILSYRFNYIFHYAALVGVERTLANPEMVLGDIQGIKNILNLAKNTGVNRVFYSSSSEVYGEPVEFPQNEHTTPLNSKLPYAIVKNVGEAFLRSYKKSYDLNYTIFRFFNTYGPNQSQDFVMSKFIHAALRNDPIALYGDGSQTRTFCYVDDNIEATTNAFYQNQYVNDIINIGSDIEISIKELAEKIIKKTNSQSNITYLPALEEGDMTRRKPDINKMKSLLKRDMITVDEGIERMIKDIKMGNG